MSQNFSLPVGTDRLNVAIKTKIADSLDALRTLHSGTSEPSLMIENMLWLDTSVTPSLLKLRDTSNSAWISMLSVSDTTYTQMQSVEHAGSLSATTTKLVGSVPRTCTVARLVLMATNASTSTSGNEWQVQVTKYPTASPTDSVTMMSAACGTFTSVVGIGGGVEFVANKALVFTTDQNNGAASNDVIGLTITKVGSATTLTDFRAFIEVI